MNLKRLARIKHLPNSFIEKLAKDDSLEVRAIIAERKDLPFDIIKKLAYEEGDENRWIRAAIAQRADLPLEIIQKLSKDKNILIKKIMIDRKDYQWLKMNDLLKESYTKEDYIKMSLSEFDNLRKIGYEQLKN
jgi:hypothetical protein